MTVFPTTLAILLLGVTSTAEAAPNYKWKEEGSFVACHQVMDVVNGREATVLVQNERCKKPATAFRLQMFDRISQCVEFDTESSGKKIRLPAPMEKCAKGPTTFRWEKPALLSECFEVDSATGGKAFRAPSDGCLKPATRFEERREVMEYGCFEVDIASKGGQFIAEAPLSKCPNGLNPNFWANEAPARPSDERRVNRSWLPKSNYQRIKEWISGGDSSDSTDAASGSAR